MELAPENLKNLSPAEQREILQAFNLSYLNATKQLHQTNHNNLEDTSRR